MQLNYNKYIKYKTKYVAIKDEIDAKKRFERWNNFFNGPDKSTVIVRIGTLASGKTTAIDYFIENNLGYDSKLFPLIELDRIVVDERNYSGDYLDIRRKIDADSIVHQLFINAVKKSRTFSIESTGSWICPPRKIVTFSNKHNYNNIGIFTFVPYFVNLQRLRSRNAQSERKIEEKVLIDNFLLLYRKIFNVIEYFDQFYIIDNSEKLDEQSVIAQSDLKLDPDADEDLLCAKWISISPRIDKLIKKIKDNEDKYQSDKEKKIFNLEMTFLNNLKLEGNIIKTCY